jgi:gamma-tubulin complex component 2
MQTCTVFATYTNWLSRELEKADPDLSGTTKPPNMTDDQWRHFQSIRTQKTAAQQQQQQQTQNQSQDPNSSVLQPTESTTTTTNTNNGAASTEEARIAELFDVMRKWETNFSRHLQILLDALNHYAATETVVLLSLCARLSTANQGTEYAGMRGGEEEGGGAV